MNWCSRERKAMGKQEFIEQLKHSLNGSVSPSLVMENIQYYEDYINTEIRKGRNEDEVLSSLGDPRLIARTILETNQQESGAAQDAEFREAGYSYGYQGGIHQDTYDSGTDQRRFIRIPGWVWLVAVILIVVLVISAVFSVLSFLAPVILPIILVLFLVKLFRDWLN